MVRPREHAGVSILIVDDEHGLGEMLKDVLVDVGYDVSLAINGRRALDRLQERTFDVVLTDVMMPVMDGVELARILRADARHQLTRIVLMTAMLSVAPAEAGLYDAVLEKPFTPDSLFTTLSAVRLTPRLIRDR